MALPVAPPVAARAGDWSVAGGSAGGPIMGSNASAVVESVKRMPTISAFYGILIRMFFNDHPPPHFHARYGEFEATVDLGTLELVRGELPHRALNLVQEWATIHRDELFGSLAVLPRE
jgi:hypothetical protein